FIHDDVQAATRPRVDAVAALNFSTFIYHDPASLLAYFKAARRSLRPQGVFVIDAYGGPGAMQPMLQRRRVIPDPIENVQPFEYQWEQRRYDAATNRVQNHIHFRVGRRLLRSAFRYNWR